MRLTSDQQILWAHGWMKINGTLVTTWTMMLLMAVGAKLATRGLTAGRTVSRWQASLEIVVSGIAEQIGEAGLQPPEKYLAFLGTLFLFVVGASLCTLIPGLQPPTGSLSTTAALAICVFLAVPFFGIRQQGWAGYLRTYLEPTWIMLPFNLIGELSRTLALAVRLFGNMMSGAMIVGILLTITPLLFPIAMTALGLLTGMVQAYIFSILGAVYIAAAIRTHKRARPEIFGLIPSRNPMDNTTLIAVASIVTAGLTTGVGCMCPALGEGRAVATALTSLAQQPDASATITRTLFVGLAMIESTAIYCFVVSMILIFANPFWTHVLAQGAGK